MAGINVPYHRSILRSTTGGDRSGPRSPGGIWQHLPWAKLSPAAFVLGIFGYFMLLGSVAVVVITHQFPWFTVAPVTILSALAYFRHVEAKEARRSSRDVPRH